MKGLPALFEFWFSWLTRGCSRLLTLPRDSAMTTSSSKSNSLSPCCFTAPFVEQMFCVRAWQIIVRFEFQSALRSGLSRSASKLICDLVCTFKLLSWRALLNVSTSLMKFDAAVFLITFEFVSAKSCKLSIAFRRFSHAVVAHESTKFLNYSIKFLSTGLLTEVVRFLNVP